MLSTTHIWQALGLMLFVAVAFAAAQSPSPPWASSALRQRYDIRPENLRLNLYRIVNQNPEVLRDCVRESFRSYIEQPEKILIDLAPTSRFDLLQGNFSRIRFEFTSGKFEGILVNRTEVDIGRPVINLFELLLHDRLRFRAQGPVDFLVEISEAELNRSIFSGTKGHTLIDPHVQLRDGSIRFSAKVRYGLGTTSIRVDGSFKLVQGTQIHFVPSGLKVSILPIPGFVARQVFDRLNPIADLSRVSFKALPDIILSRPGRLFILTSGMADRIR